MSSLPAHQSGFVAVVGRPNVGKSSLINALLGQKVAIVSPKPQTTRRNQLGILSEPNYQLIFVDTPGIHGAKTALGTYMNDAAGRAIADADAALWIVDSSVPPGESDRIAAERLRQLIGSKPVIIAFNKSDVLKPADILPHTEAYAALAPGAEWMLVSALRGDNLDKLRDMLVAHLPEGPALYPEDEITQTHLRDLAGELIREAALHELDQEVPHGVAVEIQVYDESQPNRVNIQADLVVERDSHKAIVIGKRGQMLKTIGTRARKEIQKLTGTPVYLELFVRVEPNWRHDAKGVQRRGYREL